MPSAVSGSIPDPPVDPESVLRRMEQVYDLASATWTKPPAELSTLLDVLFGNLDGFIELRLVPTKLTRLLRDAGFHRHKFVQSFWVESAAGLLAPDLLQDLVAWQSIGYSVYMGMSTRAARKRKAYHEIQAVWVDLDRKMFPGGRREMLALLDGFALPPTAIVSSGTGTQAHWGLSEIIPSDDRARLVAVVKGLAGALRGDPATTSFGQGLRFPWGFNLRNPWKARPVSILRLQAELRYTLADFEALNLPRPKRQPRSTRRPSGTSPGRGRTPSSDKERAHYDHPSITHPPPDLRLRGVSPRTKMLVTTSALGGHQSRSETDWEILRDLLGLGFSDLDLEALSHENPDGYGLRYFDRQRDNWLREVHKAREELRTRAGPPYQLGGGAAQPVLPPLRDLRQELGNAVNGLASSRKPGWYLANAEPGTGKSHAVDGGLLPAGAVLISPHHAVLDEHQKRSAVPTFKTPPLTPTTCQRYDEVHPLAVAGVNYRRVICSRCPHQTACNASGRWAGYDTAEQRPSLLAVQQYMRGADFFQEYGNGQRGLVIVDEDPVGALRPMRTFTTKQLKRARARLLGKVGLVRMALARRAMAVTAVERSVMNAAKQAFDLLTSALTAAHAVVRLPPPPPLTVSPVDLLRGIVALKASAERLARWHVENRPGTPLTPPAIIDFLWEYMSGGLFGAAILPGTKQKPRILWVRKVEIPSDRVVVVLDAGVDPGLLMALAGQAPKVLTAPFVDHDSNIIQVPISSFSRSVLTQDLRKPLADRSIHKLIQALLATHFKKGMKTGLVTHRVFVDEIKKSFPADAQPQALHYGFQRGRNDIEDVDVLFVIGTPRPNDRDLLAQAVRVFGSGILEDLPEPEYVWRETTGWYRGAYRTLKLRVAHSRAVDPRFAMLEDMTIGQELYQAAGRSRAVRGGKIVLVLSTYPLAHPNKSFLLKQDLFPQRRASERLRQVFEDWGRRAGTFTMTELKMQAAANGISPRSVDRCYQEAMDGFEIKRSAKNKILFSVALGRAPQ